eukprot:8900569-Alexandrium_andersonii.AAC.1
MAGCDGRVRGRPGRGPGGGMGRDRLQVAGGRAGTGVRASWASCDRAVGRALGGGAREDQHGRATSNRG